MKNKVQEIGPYRKIEKDEDGEEEEEVVVVKIVETGIDYGTFGNIWASSMCLSRYLSTEKGRTRVNGKRVLELGSGTGLGGLSAVIFGGASSVVLTDVPEAMEDLNSNVSLNLRSTKKGSISTMSLTMGDSDNEAHEKVRTLKPDIILCSDIMYNSKMIQLVCKTLRRVVVSSKTEILIAFTDRTVKGDPEPLEKLAEHGFCCVNRVNLMGLACCRSLCEMEDYYYLDDVEVWLWELRLLN